MHKTSDIERASAVKSFEIFNSLPEAAFDNITRLASFVCGVPVALVSFIDKDKQYYKSIYGADFRISSIKNSICYFAIQQEDDLTIFEDTSKHPVTKNNPYVVSNPKIGFYAGVPLKTKEGIPIGTLCVLDYKPHSLTEEQKDALKALAGQVEQLLYLRKERIESEKANKAVLNQTNKLNNIINATRVGTWEWNLQTDQVTINERYAEMLGYTVKELTPFTKDTWFKLLHPEDHKLAEKALTACFEDDTDFYDFECRMIHKNGHMVWVFDSGKVIQRSAAGEPILVMGTHTDITNKKNTELRLQNITNNIPGVVFRYYRNSTGNDQLLQVSKGAREIWGFTPEEIMVDNMLVWNRIHFDDVKSLIKSIENAYNNFAYWSHEWRYLHPNGETRWHKGSGNPSRIDADTIVWDCFTLDITEKKRTEYELSHTIASLQERKKEIDCLFEVSSLTQQELDLDSFLSKAVEIIPGGWQFPESARASIVYDKKAYKNKGFRKTKQTLENHSTTVSGHKLSIYVSYIKKVGQDPENPFLMEEFSLLESLANSISLHKNQIESGNQRKLILESTAEGIYGIDASGICTFINPAGAKMLGYTQEECIDKNLHKLIHYKKEDGAVFPEKDCPIYKVIKSKKTVSVDEDVFWKKDGSFFPVRYSSTPIVIDNSSRGSVVVFNDITEKKQADQLLKENEKRFKSLIQEGSDLISIIDKEGCYIYVSPTSERVLGWSPEYLTGKNVQEFIHPDDWEELYEKFSLLETQKQITTQAFRYKNSKGEWRWIETTATNLYNEPSINGIVTNSRDVTERLQKDQELRESNERYNIINKATNDAIYDWDITNDTFYWGDGLQRLFGHDFSHTSFQLQDWVNLTHPHDVGKHQKRWQAFIKDDSQNTWKNEFRFLKSTGEYAYVEEIGFILRDAKGKPFRMIGALRDKTASKTADLQQQLEFEIANFFKERKNKLPVVLQDVMGYLVDFGNFETAEIWLASTDNKTLNLYATYKKSKTAKVFYKESKHITKLEKAEGLTGTVWKSNNVEILDNIDKNKKYIRYQAAKIAGLKSAFGIPLIHNKNSIGVLLFSSKLPAEKINDEINIYRPLGNYLGAEIRRKQQEDEIQLFFDNSPEIMAVVDPKGYFVKVNRAFCNILGYTQEELTSHPFTYFLHPEDLENTKVEFKETISGKRLANNFINRYRTKTGDYRWISWSSSEVYGENNFAYAYGNDITDLIEVQRLLENTAKLAKIGSWELDLRDTASKSNVFWSAMTREVMEVDENYSPTNSAGLEFFVGEHKRNLSNAVQNLIKTGQPFDLELQILSGQGNLKWVRCIGESERLNDRCVKVFGSYQDINQRKQAELKVKEALSERNNILESIGDAFFAVDNDWHVTYWNRKAEELLLTKKEDIIGKHLWGVFSAHVGLKSYNEYHKAVKFQEVVHFEDYYPENDSWLEVSAYPSKSGLSVYFKDITQRKKQEKLIQDTNERFEKITEATNDAVWDFDVVNHKLFWGKGFETQFGYSLEQTTPTIDLLVSLIHPDDRSHIANKIQMFMTDGTSTNWFEEYRFKKADGDYAFIIDRAIFIRDDNGVVTRVVGAMTDISYRREYEEALKKLNDKLRRHTKELQISNQELEQFAYVTSHDLQEPLRMISSFLMLLEKKYGDKLDEKAHEYIFYAVDGAKRMRKIILDLLEFSKVGRFNEDTENIDLNEIVEEFCILRKKIIQEKKAQINYQGLPKIPTYKVPLTQVFHNLIDNAIKYSKENEPPIINIKAKEHAEHWEFCIQDNGIGIESQYFNKIFIIFQRLHEKDIHDGTGMGLAIVKKIIDALEGKIWVTSQPGKGSSFYFTLPKTN